MLNPLLVPAGQDLLPATINYLPAGVAPSLQTVNKIPLAQALVQFHMQGWTNTLFVNTDFLKTLSDDEQTKLQKHIEEADCLTNNLAITPMPLGLTGDELIAIDTIKAGTILFYNGELINAETVEQRGLEDYYSCDAANGWALSQQHYGNYSRFSAFALDQKALEAEIGFYSTPLPIAVANLDASRIPFNGIELVQLTANRDIQPGERLRWNYKLGHFDMRNFPPSLFDPNNKIIDPVQYYWRNIVVGITIADLYYQSFQSLNVLIEQDSYYFLRHQLTKKTYDIYIHGEFYSELLINQPLLKQQHRIKMLLPTLKNPTIKYLDPSYDLDQHLFLYTNRLLGKDLKIQTWHLDTLPLSITTPFSKQCTTAYTITDMATRLDAIQQCFNKTGIQVLRQEHSLLIPQAALFKAIPSLTQLALIRLHCKALLNQASSFFNTLAILGAVYFCCSGF